MQKKKGKKESAPHAPLSEATKRRIATGMTVLLCSAAVIGTGIYVFTTLNDLDNPGEREGEVAARVDNVRTDLLDAALAKDAERRSPERATPNDLPNPFATAPAPRTPQLTLPAEASEAAVESAPAQ